MMNWLKKWMQGRYGIDQLSMAILLFALLLSLIGGFTRSWILSFVIFGIILLCYYRILSKKIYRRQQENAKFLRFYQPLQHQAIKKFNELKGLKTYKYYKCPSCHQKLRVPRGRGKVCITCPKCGKEIHKHT